MASRNIDPLSAEEPSEGREEERGAGGEWSWESQVPVKVLQAHSDAVTTARVCCDNRCILSCSSDCTAVLWDVESCQPLRTFDGVHSKAITECALIPNSNRMVTVSWDKKMVAWDLETGLTLWKSRQPGLLTSCSSSSDGRLVVCAVNPQNGISICDAASGQMLHHISDLHRSFITRCRFDPQSQRVATVSADRSIKLWDLRAQKTTVSIDSNHGNVVSACCFTSNGHFLCTASWDKTLKLWDLQAGGFRSHGGTPLQGGHEGSVSACCIAAADANLLVSASYDRTVALWDLSSLCQTLVLKGHSDWVTDVSVSADRKLVASSSKDGTVRLWDIENMEEIPEVMKKRNAEGAGIHILKCEECGKPFPVSRLLTSELLTQCVFCRLKSPPRYRPQPPPLT
ncbi:WD repeat-containing protein 88-like [Pelmatolapia mariae]|uniref:WD repeat-containing protein 88-like n=1 Tax=Pelmatolapia mariae TaxID=158779 RepID=UPI002FE60E49